MPEGLEEAARLCRTGQKDFQDNQYGHNVCTLYPLRALELQKPPCFVRQGIRFDNTRTRESYCLCTRPIDYNPLIVEEIEDPVTRHLRVNYFGQGPDKDEL